MTYQEEFSFLVSKSYVRKPLVLLFIFFVIFIWIPVCFFQELYYKIDDIIDDISYNFHNFFLFTKDELGINKLKELYKKIRKIQ